MQELQLELGEGPCAEAWAGGVPVVEPDLGVAGALRWPVFAAAAYGLGVRAVFAFPLRVGAIRIGVMVLYRGRTGGLSPEELALGIVLGSVATEIVLGLQAGAEGDALHELLADEPTHWAEIHQATGIVSVQLETSLEDALVRLRGHAFATSRPLHDIARDVVAGRLRLVS